MQKILYIILFFLISFNINAEMIKPDPTISAKEVISIQLKALQINNSPFEDAGIEQTWEFAHPNNRKFTGPLNNFIRMIKNPSYSMMIDHMDHKIIPVEEKETTSYYFVELTDVNGKKYGFEWTVEKVSENGEFKDCWMTVGVSRPMPLSQAS
tara:strand:+ start:1114 stop:1572 length:459 start_codon:yes stop_codon:yes gene_type:complete